MAGLGGWNSADCVVSGEWIKLAFLHGRDSYEGEWRYVLEENEVREKAKDFDQGEVIGILVERWSSRYKA